MNYLHPISGAAVLALLVYVGSLGLKLRTTRRDRAAIAARHARWARVAYIAVLLSWVAGALSVLLGRDDLTFAASLHFRSGTALALLLTGSALTGRAMEHGAEGARDWHPWLGGAAVLLAAAHAASGLRLTP
ncbi:MAG TPA: DUF4079 family protein [Candidatus Dormibacteraeota bacterium]|nr:DUF4079 family protein [Candidatus Dormibacteraeota bacterium]